MKDQNLVIELTEAYLILLITEVLGSVSGEIDVNLPFQELGLDSFHVLKVIKKLEDDFGGLPKTLLFENFNISDLTNYFFKNHLKTLTTLFSKHLSTRKPDAALFVTPLSNEAGSQEKVKTAIEPHKVNNICSEKHSAIEDESVFVPLASLGENTALSSLVNDLSARYKNEGSVSRGVRNIAPYLFIGRKKRGYFHYSRSKTSVLVYAYTGPDDYFAELADEFCIKFAQCQIQLNFLSLENIEKVGNKKFSSTPFGAMQRIENIEKFTLEGGKMRRLRYQVSKFEQSGVCRIEEYQGYSNTEINKDIARVIDQWCESRSMVNPLVQIAKEEILAGVFDKKHRIFLTYVNDVLQNVIIITAMNPENTAYLMDLEFYPNDMPLGGLEYGIVNIIGMLVREGCHTLSLGATFGPKLEECSNCDLKVDTLLDELRQQNIFNDEGNLQFKNKFRPNNKNIYLCRPIDSGSPDDVIDLIMMIADPSRIQVKCDFAENSVSLPSASVGNSIEQVFSTSDPVQRKSIQVDFGVFGVRGEYLASGGLNPLNIPSEKIEVDMKTDSWAELRMPMIEQQMTYWHSLIHRSIDLKESLQAVYPFNYFLLTESGRTAEQLFYKSYKKKGIILQNILFPTGIFHQIDNDFSPIELPDNEVFSLVSEGFRKANLNWDACKNYIERNPDDVALVCIEVSNNASGGHTISLEFLDQVKKSLSIYGIPLVLDATRILENALYISRKDPDCKNMNIFATARRILSYADVVIASLSKDFCINMGGLIATNNETLFADMQIVQQKDALELDVIDKKIIAHAFSAQAYLEKQVACRVEQVSAIHSALTKINVPVVAPVGCHCVLIDVKQIPPFNQLSLPVPSFLAWLYLNTGIRAAAHNVGMQKNSSLNDMVRIAVPLGLKQHQIDALVAELLKCFTVIQNIPELIANNNQSPIIGDIHSHYECIALLNPGKGVDSHQGNVASESVQKLAVPVMTFTAPVIAANNATSTFTVNQSEIIPPTGASNIRDVAIIGMSGRYPKSATMDELWENLKAGKDCIDTISDERFQQRRKNRFSKKYRGGFIEGVDRFDSLFFNISPREAEMLDPQERLFLEVAWEALEDAGYYPEILGSETEQRNIGVYVGAVWAMYQMVGMEEKLAGKNVNPNSFLWSIANRISYVMNFSGPSITIDTACSSSLTAIYLACEAIYNGECSAAIVGGVNLDLHQSKQDINSSLGALSEDGYCRSFGQGANGYVPGEGVGALLLKPLEDAIRDGDNIHGVIKSAVVNHGGRTSGYTVPNPKAQTNLILSALEKADIDARTIGYVEAHGTGTELGDPIEIAGLSNAFAKYEVAKQSCAIGSIKTNIGHAEAAAGVVGVCKTLLQMRHQSLVPSLHSEILNEFIDFENSPFVVEQKTKPWQRKEINGKIFPLRAGISSFGAGGANAHLIIEEYLSETIDFDESGEYIFPLSARDDNQLREYINKLKIHIERDLAGDIPSQLMRDISYTLQLGRKSLEHRLVAIASSKEELVKKLARFLCGEKQDDILVGHIKNADGVTKLLSRSEKEAFVQLLSQRRDPRQLAQLWIDGLLTDWQGFKGRVSGKRISLPTYPFADKRHWIGKMEASDIISFGTPTQKSLHPLIDSNDSTFDRQWFRKKFHEQDFFIYDHLVSGVPTLPGVAYLELARKAGELAANRKVQRIKNILWVSPITVEESKPLDVVINLKPSGNFVQFEVFSERNDKQHLHSQGKLEYATDRELLAEPEYIDLKAIQARCEKVIDGATAYGLFDSLGLHLGHSFQGVREVYKGEGEILGLLNIPKERLQDFGEYVLHPSLIDSSFQAGMAAQLGDQVSEMFVPYTIGEVEILAPLTEKCFSYITEVKDSKKSPGKVSKVNVLIVDETGKILVRMKESIGIPLVEVHEKPDAKSNIGKFGSTDEFTKLYYSPVWTEVDLPGSGKISAEITTVILFALDVNYREEYLKSSRTGLSNKRIITVIPGDRYQQCDNEVYSINPAQAADYKQLIASLSASNIDLGKICFAWSFSRKVTPEFSYNVELIEQALQPGVYAMLYLCQALVEEKIKGIIEIVYLFSTTVGNGLPHHEAVGGFAKTLLIEHPKLLCKTLEIRQREIAIETSLDLTFKEFNFANSKDYLVRYVDGQRFVRKVQEFNIPDFAPSSPGSMSLRHNGVYLITGGLGGLGLIFAEYLAKECKAKLVLTGRSEISVERQKNIDLLKEQGAEVIYVAADIARRGGVEKVLSLAQSHFGEVNGIIHAAGVLRDSYLRSKTIEDMQAVFSPKLFGTVLLDELTATNKNLDFFVLFSSLAAIGGNAAQCDYSYANYFMDAFAARREELRAQGQRFGKSLSLNWALWAEGGMSVDEQTATFFRKNLGINPLSKEIGLETFLKGLAFHQPQLVVIDGVKAKVEKAWGLVEEQSVEPSVIAVTATDSSPKQDEEDDLIKLTGDELWQAVKSYLKLDDSDKALDKILLDFGFDSIGLTSYANLINEKYQLDLTPVLFFEYPSIKEIATFLANEHRDSVSRYHQRDLSSSTPEPALQKAGLNNSVGNVEEQVAFGNAISKGQLFLDNNLLPASENKTFSFDRRFAEEPIAIVGMSGIFPQSDNVDEFWDNIHSAKNLITEIPRDRWNWEDYFGDPLTEENKTNSKWGGFMRELDKFDPLFFGISPREAELMDPQQRIFLQTVWRAIEDSGHKVSDLSGTKTGLFVGVSTNEYSNMISHSDIGLDPYSCTGNSHSVLVNRISYLLNLRGPSAPLDTACSSSLIALHRAIESIHTGSSDMAIVGGVQIMIAPAAHIFFSKAGMLSDDGKCKTFDKRANGYVRGEGTGAILIKPLSKAEADGDHIYAIIKATAENHGGKANALTAPNPNAQAELLIEAYGKAEIDPATVGYIECHGTGTSLGDPIEIQALKKSFAELYKRNNKAPAITPHCGLSSVKTNIGHLETAAGIAAIVKVLQAIKHKKIPASLHLEEINPYIDLQNTPFYIVDKTIPWNAVVLDDGTSLPRRAGISSFGFGGANAHVVLEEYFPKVQSAAVGSQQPFLSVISAKNENRLKEYAFSLLAYLEKNPHVKLEDFAYTLQVGRDVMIERAAFISANLPELKQQLNQFLEGDMSSGKVFRGNAKKDKVRYQPLVEGKSGKVMLETLFHERELNRLAEFWAGGIDLDWMQLYPTEKRQRLSVPTYPFARDRYWLPTEKSISQLSGLSRAAVSQLHPLVHQNVSTLQEQKFVSHFTGNEFFLTDHVVETHKILPGVAYMEIGRVAGELAGKEHVRFIRNLVWMSPLIVGEGGKDIEVILTPVRNEVEFTVRSLQGEEYVNHCIGRLAYSDEGVMPSILPLADIQQRCTEEVISNAELYPLLRDSGLKLGKGFQIVQRIFATESESLSILQLPEHLRDGAGQFWLHPALMDGSLHTAIGLIQQNSLDNPLSLPFSVGEVEVIGSLEKLHYGYATWSDTGGGDPNRVLRVNFDLLDKDGNILVRIKDFFSKPFSKEALVEFGNKHIESSNPKLTKTNGLVKLQSFVPVWNPVPHTIFGKADITPARILYVGREPRILDWLSAANLAFEYVQIPVCASVEEIQTLLANKVMDQLLWVSPDMFSGERDIAENFDEQQEQGLVEIFRITKALVALGYASKSIGWSIITRNAQAIGKNQTIQPAHSGLVGYVGSMAKEFTQWSTRILDVDEFSQLNAVQCLTLAWDKQGNVLAYRRGEWLRQEFAELTTSEELNEPYYRHGGVYVVIGGAGGLGEVWSRTMIENYDAKIVWIGRRNIDESIQEKIDSLAKYGHPPIYLTADATQTQSLQTAFDSIAKMYPHIHGVLHSAIVLKDQMLASMSEDTFRASLSAKVDVSVNIDRIFGQCDLDFILFFSSIVSFFKTPGQSNYAAGCTFKDTYASYLGSKYSYPVKVMNWGFWGNVGIVADESYNKIMEQVGIGSIEPQEGMDKLQSLVGSSISQTGLIKTFNDKATAAMNISETLHVYSSASLDLIRVQSSLPEMASNEKMVELEKELATEEMNVLVTKIWVSSLASLGLLQNNNLSLADLKFEKPPAPYCERWLSSSLRYMRDMKVIDANNNILQPVSNLSELWNEWDGKKSLWGTKPNQQAQINLMESCLKGLPNILSGRQLATEVIFPNSSMALVEGVYQGNALADYFNGVLGSTLVSCIKEKLAAEPQAKIRILEIGAGTGGTTAKILPLLTQFSDSIAEYCYTDLSKAFLMFGEKQYKPKCPALTTAIFDVTKPVVSQMISPGAYDIAIAANVLHATPNIRETLRNAKAILKQQGVLLMNEISEWSLFSHLTFGLLEGWWLNEDSVLRIPGNPGLLPDDWTRVLADEGFQHTFYPARKAHKLGQQIIATASDGIARQRIVKAPVKTNEAEKREVDNSMSKMKISQVIGNTARRQNGAEFVQEIIVEKLSVALKINPDSIISDTSFVEYGVDSIVGVNLVRSIAEALNIELETIVLFEFSTAGSLAEYIWSNFAEAVKVIMPRNADLPPASKSARVSPVAAQQSTPVAESTATKTITSRFVQASRAIGRDASPAAAATQTDAIAIVGVSGRFSQSESLAEYWENISSGKNLVSEVKRWKMADYFTSDAEKNRFCGHGSFIDSFDLFDPEFFKITPHEALYMDPQQRLFLEEAWKALEDAGYAGTCIDEHQCGVYVGCGSSYYSDLIGEAPALAFWGNSASVIPARIAYYLNLRGPAVAVDTACSSSLVTMHLACQGLWSGETNMALAGGVFLQATPGFYQASNRAGMLSISGKCASFDEHADGFVPGEGVGVVVLKRLKDAVRDGDNIHGVILGSGINQDGASNGLIAPNPQAQEKLERMVYERFDINPETIQLIEAHGTGTALGDAIEFGAITRSFRHYTDQKQFCAIGSVKTNIGHTATAAGVAGVLKVLLSMKHQQLPPSLHYQKGNPAINFESSPFYVNTQLQGWSTANQQPRRAAVSAFGFSGTNAHLVIEEPPMAEPFDVDLPAYMMVLSARTAGQLTELAKKLLQHSLQTPDLCVNDLCFTLYTGRMHMVHRFACVIRSQAELVDYLQRYLNNESGEDIFTGEVSDGKLRERVSLRNFGYQSILECAEHIHSRGMEDDDYIERLSTIADLYVQGYVLSYELLFPQSSKRISLPTYPFSRQRYWVESSSSATPKPVEASSALHPLLHRNTSDFYQHRYSSRFTGNEFFIKNHRLHEQPVMISVAYMAMARAALWHALPDKRNSAQVELKNVAWGAPLEYRSEHQVSIALFSNNDDSIGFEVLQQATEQDSILCQGNAYLIAVAEPQIQDINELRESFSQTSMIDGKTIYAEYLASGISYGPGLQSVSAVYQGQEQLLVVISLPENEIDQSNEYELHSAIVDGALQASRLLLQTQQQFMIFPSLPVSLDSMQVLSTCESNMWAWVRHSGSSTDNDELKLDIDLLTGEGRVAVRMRGITWIVSNNDSVKYVIPTNSDEVVLTGSRYEFFAKDKDAVKTSSLKLTAREKSVLLIKQFIAEHNNFPLEAVDMNANLMDLGLTSIGCAELTHIIRKLVDPDFSPTSFFEYSTGKSLSGYLYTRYTSVFENIGVIKQTFTQEPSAVNELNSDKISPSTRKKSDENQLQLLESSAGKNLSTTSIDDKLSSIDNVPLHLIDADSTLGLPEKQTLVTGYNGELKNIFLTGATGFLGIHILAELSLCTSINIYCLVRATDENTGLQRIIDSAKRFECAIEQSRIKIICGDITKPKLGMSDKNWKLCCQDAQHIIHASAHVNHLESYASFRPAVAGIKEIITLAGTSSLKLIHFMSSTAACMQMKNGKFVLFEKEEFMDDGADVFGGYGKSKWVQETLLKRASSHGIPYVIYRFGELSGSSKTGLAQTNDMLHRLLQMKLALGCREKISSDVLDLFPVDHAAKIIVTSAASPEMWNRIVHATHPDPCPMSFMYRFAQQKGLRFDPVTKEEYWEKCREYIRFITEQSTVDGFVLECALRDSEGSLKNTKMADGYFAVLFPFNQDALMEVLALAELRMPQWQELFEVYFRRWSEKNNNFLKTINNYLLWKTKKDTLIQKSSSASRNVTKVDSKKPKVR